MESLPIRKGIGRTVAVVIVVIVIIVAAGAGYAILAATSTSTSSALTSALSSSTSSTSSTGCTSNIGTIMIGVDEPMTGSGAVYGVDEVDGGQIAITDINSAGGITSLCGAKLQLVVEDSQSTLDGAAAAAQKLLSVDQVHIVIGNYFSSQTLSMLKVVGPAKVLTIIEGVVDSLTSYGYPYVFRVDAKDSLYGSVAAQFVHDEAAKHNLTVSKVVILNEDSIFGQYGYLGILQLATNYGWNVVDHIQYSSSITDMTSIVQRVINDNADAVFINPYYSDAILFAKTAKTLGLKAMFIAGSGGSGFTDPQSVASCGSACDYYSNSDNYSPYINTTYNRQFVKEFTSKYGHAPDTASGIMAMEVWTLRAAIEAAGQICPSTPLDADCLKKAMLSLNLDIANSNAAQLNPTLRIAFDPASGENTYAGVVYNQVQGNQSYLVYPYKVATTQPVFPLPGWSPNTTASSTA